MQVSEVAAKWALEDGAGKPGVVIFTDSTYQIAIDKADRIKATIEAGGGTVLEYVDTPIAETSTRMGPLTTNLLQKYGASWTHALAINDLYFDFMGPALAAAGIAGDGAPLAGSAGDGSEAAFQRIRGGQYQAITVAEPLNLQGWQLVDELNRAVSGAACSGYVTAPALVTKEGLAKMGDSNAFDPDSPYRESYAAIWGK
jgi:ribose transport system substrate-binding protein